MKTRPPLSTLFALALLLAAPAAASDRPGIGLEILVDGVPLTEYTAAGRRYIEAVEGHEYSIRLINRTAERVAVALSVDGLNTIDARTTTAREASKWILDPHRTITIDGWQTSRSTARRFFFTTEEDSYGEWLGQTENLGLISAAVFREKPPLRVPITSPREPRKSEAGGMHDRAAPEAQSESDADGMAATGIGRELDHHVRRVQFDAETSPFVRLDLRYEYRPELVRLGVLPRPCREPFEPLARRERARGFTDDGFAPDPYRACR